MGRRGHRKAEPTDDWELLLPLFGWPEQQAYEELRPLVLFDDSVAERAKETAIRRIIVELKAEHPALNNNEIANIVYVRTGRRLGMHTPERVLAEEVVPLKFSRLFEPYHVNEDPREGREAVVALHLDGLESDGHSFLPEGELDDRLPGPREVARRRR